MRHSDAEENRRLAEYAEATSDRQAGRRLGIPWYQFRDWRQSRGLPAKGKFKGALSPEEEARRLAVWREHILPSRIGRALGRSPRAIDDWARRKQLPTVKDHVALLQDGLSTRDLRFWDAYCTHTTDIDAGRAVGTTKTGFMRWRNRHGLPGHSRRTAFYQAVWRAAAKGNPIARDFLANDSEAWRGRPTDRRAAAAAPGLEVA